MSVGRDAVVVKSRHVGTMVIGAETSNGRMAD